MKQALDADGNEIHEGWYWAWRIRYGVNKTEGPWCLVYVFGEMPFLSMRLGIFSATDDAWDHGEQLNLSRRLLDPTEWEFGTRIKFPYEIEAEKVLNDTSIS